MTTTFLLPLSIGACEMLGGQCDDGCFWRGGAGRADPADRRAADGRRLPNEDEPRRETAAPAFDGRDEIVELEEEWA